MQGGARHHRSPCRCRPHLRSSGTDDADARPACADLLVCIFFRGISSADQFYCSYVRVCLFLLLPAFADEMYYNGALPQTPRAQAGARPAYLGAPPTALAFHTKKAHRPVRLYLCYMREINLSHYFWRCQIYLAYSSTERSAENMPAPEMFMRLILAHLSVSL